MVEEAAPLVVDDEEGTAFELRALEEGVDDVGHERLAEPHVPVRVLVAGGPRSSPLNDGSTKESGQGAGRAAFVVLLDLARACEARRSPEGRDRDVGVEVAVRDPCVSAAKIVESGNPPLDVGIELSFIP